MIANNKCGDISEEAAITTTTQSPPSSSPPPPAAAAEQEEAVSSSSHTKKWNCKSIIRRTRTYLHKYSFLILITLAILLAYIYPPLGAHYLASNITSDWIAVILIFFISGLTINSTEFHSTAICHRPMLLFHILYIQFYNFIVVSGIVYGTSRLLLKYDILPISLTNGMVICSCLPITVSMVTVLTTAAHGDTAMSIFHAVLGNIIGVFISPLLITFYLDDSSSLPTTSNSSSSSSSSTSRTTIIIKLVLRIIVPLFIGQILVHYFIPPPYKVYIMNKYKSQIKYLQECILTFIVYCTFCHTFSNNNYIGNDDTNIVSAKSIIIMIIMQGILLITVMSIAWISLKYTFGTQHPKLVAMGLFGCTHKTVALGIPLISTMFSSSSNNNTDPTTTTTMMGLYTLPLLIWHPLQLLFGSGIAPHVGKYVDRRETEIILLLDQQTTAASAAVVIAEEESAAAGTGIG